MTGNLADYYYFDLSLKNAHLTESRYESSSNGRETLLYEVFSPDGIHIWYYRTALPVEKTVTADNNSAFFRMHFEFNTASSYLFDGGAKKITTYSGGRFNLLFIPPGKYSMQIPASDKLELFNCNITPETFLQYIPDTHPLYERLSELLNHPEAASLVPEYPANSQIVRQIVVDILNCPLEKQYKQLYLKAKILELLTIQLDAFDQFEHQKFSGTNLREEDIQRMEKVREWIDAHPQIPFTVGELARMVGTNENYLKKHFKQRFGTTILQYTTALRMERAKGLLKQGEPISRVAALSGYKHTSHFTNAFKRYFGYTPGQL